LCCCLARPSPRSLVLAWSSSAAVGRSEGEGCCVARAVPHVMDACLLGIFRLRVYAKTGAVSALPLRPSVGYRATYHCCGLVWCLGWLTVVCFRKGAVWHLLLCVIVLFERKGGEGVLEPVTWHDPLLVVSARRCLSPCPNPSPALRASFGFEPISSVYLSIYVENYQNKLPPISALQSHWALRTLHAAMQPCSR
jgi:hypothetical protein